MLVVCHDKLAVEWALRAGLLPCPNCGASLRPWGRARIRRIRFGAGPDLHIQPRRTRCVGCRQTHVLLPDWMTVRRAYATVMIRAVLAAHASGIGYRKIARGNNLPLTTVRDWLRACRRSALQLPDSLVQHEPAPMRGSITATEAGMMPISAAWIRMACKPDRLPEARHAAH